MSGKSDSDATYCSEAEALLKPPPMPKPVKELRRSQRLSQKAVDIKFSWDNFIISDEGKLININPQSVKSPNKLPPSVDILADTQNHSEPLPLAQKCENSIVHHNQTEYAKSPIHVAAAPSPKQAPPPNRKRRFTNCLPHQPQDVLQPADVISVPLDLSKRPKLDCHLKSTTAHPVAAIVIDLTTDGIDEPNKNDLPLGENSPNFCVAKPRFGLSKIGDNESKIFVGAAQATTATLQANEVKGKKSSQNLQFSEAENTNPKVFSNNSVRLESNEAVEQIKTQKKNETPREAPYRRMKSKVPSSGGRKKIITKYMNLVDFAKEQPKPATVVQVQATNIPKVQPVKNLRYFDNRTQQPIKQYQPRESLLPAVYPPHYHEVVAPPPRLPPLHQNQTLDSNFYLTPDSEPFISEFAARSSTSTPSLPESLREVFDTDDVREILHLEKTVYHLSEQHLKTLAVVINLKVEYLREVLDSILTLSPAVLEKTELLLDTLSSGNCQNAARTRPFNNQNDYDYTTVSSGKSSVVEGSPNQSLLRHFPSQRRETQ